MMFSSSTSALFVFALIGLASAMPAEASLEKRQMAKLIKEWHVCQGSLKGSGVTFETPKEDSIVLENVPAPCMALAVKEIKAIMMKSADMDEME